MARFRLSQLRGDEGPFDPGVPEEIVAAAEARSRAILAAEAEDAAPDEPAAPVPDPEGPAAPPDGKTAVPDAQKRRPGVDPDPGRVADHASFGMASQHGPGTLPGGAVTAGPSIRGLQEALRDAEIGILTPGDPEEGPDAAQGDPEAAAYGSPDDDALPPRPSTWPIFLAWPPAAVLRRLRAKDISAEQRRAMVAELLDLDRKMVSRAREIDAWLQENSPWKRAWSPYRHAPLDFYNSDGDPHCGIRWATLLNPGLQDKAIAASVSAWGHTQARCIDGGIVRVTDRHIGLGGVEEGRTGLTLQAVRLAIHEARSRGWEPIRMSGCYEFGMLAIQAAKEAGVTAEISWRGKGMFALKRYRLKVMPQTPLPADLVAAARAATPSGLGADGAAQALPGIVDSGNPDPARVNPGQAGPDRSGPAATSQDTPGDAEFRTQEASRRDRPSGHAAAPEAHGRFPDRHDAVKASSRVPGFGMPDRTTGPGAM